MYVYYILTQLEKKKKEMGMWPKSGHLDIEKLLEKEVSFTMTKALMLSLPLNDVVWGCEARFLWRRPLKTKQAHEGMNHVGRKLDPAHLPNYASKYIPYLLKMLILNWVVYYLTARYIFLLFLLCLKRSIKHCLNEFL